MQEVAEVVIREIGQGRQPVIGRVIGLKGFSTVPVDELVAIDASGRQHGNLLGRPGAERLVHEVAEMRKSPDSGLRVTTVDIHGPEVSELGLACGGRAEVLLQSTASIPSELWALLAARAPAALVTRIEGEGSGPTGLVVDGQGRAWGSLPGTPVQAELVTQAASLLASGHSGVTRVESEAGVTLIESWVPSPRLVIVGSGEVVTATQTQAGLLGWEARFTEEVDELGDLLEWAGATAALIVLSHNPHVDVPALSSGLRRNIPYVGAMGSRGTQSRRLERLAADGIEPDLLDRIHRPIGLNLGGRKAPEVALAIVAEILACHNGRDGRPLKEWSGPIH